MPTLEKQKIIAVLVFPGVNLIDVAGPLQAFETANRVLRPLKPLYKILVASEHGGPVESSPGLPLSTRKLSELDGIHIDTLIVPGGSTDTRPPNNKTLSGWISQNAGRIRRVCSVCTGAFILSDAGVLDGKRVATHWKWVETLRSRNSRIIVEANPIFIQDGSVWTSAGVSSGIDLSLSLISSDAGNTVSISVARDLVVYMKRPGGQAQYSAPLAAQTQGNGSFDELSAWIADNLTSPLGVEFLAAQSGMSPRNFARQFKDKTGMTPAKAVEAIRIEVACRYLYDSEYSIKKVARLVGCGSEQNLRRLFKRLLGINPLQYRERFSSL
ncbi:GlxA family transcriptional regulator (plasmid) [Rhizobium sp. NIBRBAC000502774]|nr:GlxA family transcriptional regulator [Rhizobium sp. NIBRBAC000502774]